MRKRVDCVKRIIADGWQCLFQGFPFGILPDAGEELMPGEGQVFNANVQYDTAPAVGALRFEESCLLRLKDGITDGLSGICWERIIERFKGQAFPTNSIFGDRDVTLVPLYRNQHIAQAIHVQNHKITSLRPHSTTWGREGQDDIQKEGVRGCDAGLMSQNISGVSPILRKW